MFIIPNVKMLNIERQGKLKSRAVVFRLFQKTVILPPNPVGFRLTYTQLWDMFFIQYV